MGPKVTVLVSHTFTVVLVKKVTIGYTLQGFCLETMKAIYSIRADLKEQPLGNAEDFWFTDGSSFVKQRVCKAGYAVTTTHKVIEAKSLPSGGTSAQKAEVIAFTPALGLSKGKKINTWTDSK